MSYAVTLSYVRGPRTYTFSFPNRELAVAFVGGYMGAEMATGTRSEIVYDDNGEIAIDVDRI